MWGRVGVSWRCICRPACVWLAGQRCAVKATSQRLLFFAVLPRPSCLQAVGRDAEIGEEAIQRFIAAQFAGAAADGGGGAEEH